jgi:hypothetical protein
MRKSAKRAMVAAAGVLAILSSVGGTGLAGQARADTPPCVADATDPCPLQADAPNADPPPAPHVRVFCHSAGPKWGAHCYQRIVP